MIPKTIHYCWFGGNPLPKSAVKYIKSWKKFCPDYQIIEWNESNFDVNCNQYCSYMYNHRKWAFLTDYVRLRVVYENGGIYLDTDVQMLKSFDNLLSQKAFMGLETSKKVATGLGFGAEAGHPFIQENMMAYETLTSFENTPACPEITTKLLRRYSESPDVTQISVIADVTIYPEEYFCPMDSHTGLLHKTANSYSIHHFDASWNPAEKKKMEDRWKYYKMQDRKQLPKVLVRKIFGDEAIERVKSFLKRES
ncbi:MAG: glycosyl transferase [Clostridiales bacterium]|nr:glycosyl transferase [Clostridiales bacterium]